MIFREFFYLQKSDRKVILTLLCVIAVALVVIFWTGGQMDGQPSADSLRHTGYRTYAKPYRQPSYYVAPRKVERFPFDPNTADSTQLLRLGLQPWQVRNIYKYRAKGGIYRQPSDFAKLYGLTVKDYRELAPYIRISKDYLPASTLVPKARTASPRDSFAPRYPEKIREGETIELNLSDTTALKTVPGIGSYYARKIVQYRERLGGYASLQQLSEIEGFPEDAKRFLRISQPDLQKLNVNKLPLEALRRHPYINFYQAKAITDYRRLHGPIRSLNDLSLSKDFPQEAIDRLQPYVEF